MNWLYKLERKFGRYAMDRLPLYLIFCYVVGYAIQIATKGSLEIMGYLSLNPYLILHGQVWRLVSWILIPPESLSFFTLIMLYFYYSVSNTLTNVWGSFRFNVYLLGGMLFTVIGSFAMMGYVYLTYPEEIALLSAAEVFGNLQYVGGWFMQFSTYYINMSIFLAFAATFPDAQVYLMFLLPIRIKILGIIYAVMLAYQFFTSNIVIKFVIGASLLNFIIFFLSTRNYKRISPSEIHRRNSYRRKVREAYKGDNVVSFNGKRVISRHKCAVCGRTEHDDDTLVFRFCSKCDGNYEYCNEHLNNHEHVKKPQQEEIFH